MHASSNTAIAPGAEVEGHGLSLPFWCGIVALVVGFVDVVGWWTHATLLSPIVHGMLPMKFNVGFCLILLGGGLALLAQGQNRIAGLLGLVVALFAASMLVENMAGFNFHTDPLLFNSYIHSADPFPNRASPLSSGCLTLLGISLLLSDICLYHRV
jgi:hypothetical protein